MVPSFALVLAMKWRGFCFGILFWEKSKYALLPGVVFEKYSKRVPKIPFLGPEKRSTNGVKLQFGAFYSGFTLFRSKTPRKSVSENDGDLSGLKYFVVIWSIYFRRLKLIKIDARLKARDCRGCRFLREDDCYLIKWPKMVVFGQKMRSDSRPKGCNFALPIGLG